jgi:hypothetical protein
LVEDATEDDLYDDAIAGSDEDFGKILDWLERKNKLKNTIVVYSSDHGRRWSIDRKVPLLFRFPTLHGPLRRTDNASLLDIAPTLLDYLHLDIPKYMEGRSLLENYESVPILAVEGDIPVERVLHIDCQHWSSVALNEDKVRQGIFAHHTSPCSNQPLTRMEVRKQVIDYVLPRAKMIRKAPGTLMERLWYGEIAH